MYTLILSDMGVQWY